MTQLYFDHAASAPRREEVVAAMEKWQHGVVGNPSGAHRAAREARKAVEDARDEVAAFLGAKPGNVIFTGGGTEACHLAVAGVVNKHRRNNPTTSVVVSKIEHHAVLDCVEMLERDYDNVSVRYIDVDSEGVVDISSLESLITDDTALVSVMSANNETGVIQPISAVAGAVGARCVTHTDAVAVAPFLNLAEFTKDMDMISICSHKIGGPVNSGALILRSDVSFDAIVPGGGQEKGHRGGTVDVAAAVGLAAAAKATMRDHEQTLKLVTSYQDKIIAAAKQLKNCEITASNAARLPGTVHLTFDGIASDELLFLLDQEGVCASAAASCSSGAAEPSHVLSAMGVPLSRARGSLRLSFGSETKPAEVDALIGILGQVVSRLLP
jgi:cysteine desulfurase